MLIRLSKTAFLLSLTLLFPSSLFCCDDYFGYFVIDEDFKDYVYNFEPLDDEEVISYILEDRNLSLYAKKNNGQKRLIGEWENIYWGSLEFSEDRRKALFGYYEKGHHYPLFLVDSSEGTVEYLFNVSKLMKSNINLDYIMFYNSSESSNVFSNEQDGTVKFTFYLADITNHSIVREISWGVNRKRLGGGFILLRSDDPQYDFRLIYQVESTLWAEAYYSIEDDQLEIIIDDTELDNWRSYPYTKTQTERGYFPPDENP